MRIWQNHSTEERQAILQSVSKAMLLPPLAIEKDWWVTMVLKALTLTQYAPLMSFKGGTSLSKCWNLIERFSEDIDVALRREERFAINGTSNTQLAKARRTARHYIVRELPIELEKMLHELGVSDFTVEPELVRISNGEAREIRADAHPSVVYVNYKSVVPEVSNYLQPRVKIELSCLSMDEPVEERVIRSFISEIMKEADDAELIFKTVSPTRTFLEKIFLLHEEFQKERPRSKRMSRHLYDLEKIMDTDWGRQALADSELYNQIVEHRRVFNNVATVDYATHAPATINFIPPVNVLDEWKRDYEMLTEQFLYFNETKLTFERLIARMQELEERIKSNLSR